MKGFFLRRSNIVNNEVLEYQIEEQPIEPIQFSDMYVTCSEEWIFEELKNELKKYGLGFQEFSIALSKIGIILPVHITKSDKDGKYWWRIIKNEDTIFRIKIEKETENMCFSIKREKLPIIIYNTYEIYVDERDELYVSMIKTNVRKFSDGIDFKGSYIKNENNKYQITRTLTIQDEIGMELYLKMTSQNLNIISKNIELVDDYFMELHRNSNFEEEIAHILFLMQLLPKEVNELEIVFELRKSLFDKENYMYKRLILNQRDVVMTYFEDNSILKQYNTFIEPKEKQVNYEIEYETDNEELKQYVKKISKAIGIHHDNFGMILKNMKVVLPVKLSKLSGFRFNVEQQNGEKFIFEFYSNNQMYLCRNKERKRYMTIRNTEYPDSIKIWCSQYERTLWGDVKHSIEYIYPNDIKWTLTRAEKCIRLLYIKNAPSIFIDNMIINNIFFELDENTNIKKAFFDLINKMGFLCKDLFAMQEFLYEEKNQKIQMKQTSNGKMIISNFDNQLIECESITMFHELNSLMYFIEKVDIPLTLKYNECRFILEIPEFNKITIVLKNCQKESFNTAPVYGILLNIIKDNTEISLAKYYFEIIDRIDIDTEKIWESTEISIYEDANKQAIKYEYNDGYRKFLVRLKNVEESKYTIMPIPNVKYLEKILTKAKEGLL